MRLTVINGSPRGKSSNTKLLLDQFLHGFMQSEGNSYETFYLNNRSSEPELQKNFLHAEAIVIGFPLYTDAMPGMVKEYFEMLEQFHGVNPGVKMGFIVQSGFPESFHSFFISRYLKKFAEYLEADFLGIAIKGGVEGIKIMPEWMKRKTFSRFRQLGKLFGQFGRFDKLTIKKLSKPVKLSGFRVLLYRLMKATGMSNYYWNMQLKENNAFEKRFAAPYKN
jgi:NAD(P)H-dependent FMN reductase